MKIFAGILSILASLCIGGSMIGLMITFEYPQIIRKDPIYILKKINRVGKIIPFLFYIFGMGGFIIVFASIAFEQFERESGETIFSQFALVSGIIYGILLFIGILRYFKLFPQLAVMLEQQQVTEKGAREIYQIVNVYIGETICEHIAFLFLGVMILCNSISLLTLKIVGNGLGIGGIVIAIGLLIGNTEFLGVKKVFIVNRIFSSLSAIWLLTIGFCLLI
jgi:hypothetical protein